MPLAADNTARLCGKCNREQHAQLRDAPARHNREFFDTDDLRAAFQRKDMGRVFTAYRNHPRHLKLFGKALNQETLGRWLGLNQAQISKIEHGSRPETRLDILTNWAKILQLPPDMLWFDMPNQSRFASNHTVGQGTDIHDDTIEVAVARSPNDILVATTSVFELDQLTHLRERPRGVDQGTLDSLAHVLHESRLLEDRIGAAPLLAPMCGHLMLVERLVIDARGSLRERVVSLGSQYAQFAAWVHASAGNATMARQYYDRATEWALEADDANMVSTALSMKGHLAYRLRQLGPMLGLSPMPRSLSRSTS